MYVHIFVSFFYSVKYNAHLFVIRSLDIFYKRGGNNATQQYYTVEIEAANGAM